MTKIEERYLALIKPAFKKALFVANDSRYDELFEGALYAVEGGKHVRPQLFLAVAEVYSMDLEKLLPFALALEFIHAYSLVHDDLPAMDNDLMRHGKPSVHAVYGEAMAILIGDFLLNRAYELLLENAVDKNSLNAARRLAHAAGGTGMIAGQVMDIKKELADQRKLSNQERLELHTYLDDLQEKKTAMLLAASVLMPLDLGLPFPKDYRLWEKFAYELGLAFQLKDDLLDLQAKTEELGKTTGKDQRDKKLTYPRLLGLPRAEEHYRSLCRSLAQRLEAIEALPGIGKRLEPVILWTQFLTERTY